ncbi:6-carboxytetrahydropterin synthase QueD [Phosphitispora sp. TUW77]|uniref:6-carboxytetrahydropterin synthase QueD n=1 Tax=Phosphitispora sp. TUW77 TaxID=3152361 RepID=UPI003AB531EE
MYEISAVSHFDAAHFLRGYAGKCANIHGHRWKVAIKLTGSELDDMGILVDFMDVKQVLKEVTEIFDHKLINDIPPFDQLNPTAENIAKMIFDEMKTRLYDRMQCQVNIAKVTVWESENTSAAYYEI